MRQRRHQKRMNTNEADDDEMDEVEGEAEAVDYPAGEAVEGVDHLIGAEEVEESPSPSMRIWQEKTRNLGRCS